MELNTYGNEAARTAVFPIDTGFDYLLSSLPEEVGEFSAIFAKAARNGRARNLSPEERDKAKAELGDILWNVALIARQLDTNLETIAQHNLNKLADRAARNRIEGNGDNR
ncbi:MazG nucleotide pyrophosphohydrolase domain-containing protein [Arthrobacter sp. MDT1-65]